MSIKTSLSLVVFVLVFSHGVQAQTALQKFEVGLQYTSINLKAFDSTEDGVGLRLSYHINNYLSVEAEGNIFEFSIGDHPTDDVLAAQGLLGVKAGLRNRWIGAFAKVRPGVANFPQLKGPRGFCFPGQSCDRSRRGGNRLAVDTGAILELYPTETVIVRIDIGDTMIRFSDEVRARIDNGFSHNFQFAGSVGFRF